MVGRYTDAPVKIGDLPYIDYIVITHNHYDHLERKTIQLLNKHNGVKFIVPLGVGSALVGWGVERQDIIELGWGDDAKLFKDLTIIAEPAIHFSGRWINDQGKTLWNSYVIKTDKVNIFCAGDGAYGEQIDLIARKYRHFELIMVESDAWNVRWPYFHMFTRETMEVIKKMNAKYLLPVHWGIFNLGMHKFSTSINMLKQEAEIYGFYNKLLLPAMGEKVVFHPKTYNAVYNKKSISYFK